MIIVGSQKSRIAQQFVEYTIPSCSKQANPCARGQASRSAGRSAGGRLGKAADRLVGSRRRAAGTVKNLLSPKPCGRLVAVVPDAQTTVVGLGCGSQETFGFGFRKKGLRLFFYPRFTNPCNQSRG